MVNRKKRSPARNKLLAAKLHLWSGTHNLESDPYLTGITDAIERKRSLAMWAALDPMMMLPQPQTKGNSRTSSINHYFVIVRNVLVFAPVALTWAAVGKATAAFSVFVERNPDAVANFLEFWQNGYGVLASEWTIGHIAMLDFLLISAVIALTLTTSILGKKIEDAKEIESRLIEVERTSLAVEISNFLFDKQRVTNVTMNKSLATAIQNLLNVTENLSDVAERLKKID